MTYDGVEIIMFYVGDADAILLNLYEENDKDTILIDGGYKSDGEEIVRFLEDDGIQTIDHLVNTHPDKDHAEGLIPVVKSDIEIEKAWMHLPEQHTDDVAEIVRTLQASSQNVAMADRVLKSLKLGDELRQTLERNNIDIDEPFEGEEIGPLLVHGPSEEYYSDLLDSFRDREEIEQMDSALQKSQRAAQQAHMKGEPLEESPPTSAENNSSVISSLTLEGEKFAFTADAGVDALKRAHKFASLGAARWVQIPHHGSRRNVNEELIETFDAEVAYVSAKNSMHHPSPQVVQKFQEVGSEVYATFHEDPAKKRHRYGDVPERDWSDSDPLPADWSDS